jgi:hypothetical protein
MRNRSLGIHEVREQAAAEFVNVPTPKVLFTTRRSASLTVAFLAVTRGW